MSYSKEEIIKYRLERANESFADAEVLFKTGRKLSVVNRLYYACFYAISAYFVQQNLKAFTHSGLKSSFNRALVLSGKVSAEEGRHFNQLFTFRQDADYKDFVEFDDLEIKELFPKVKKLMELMEILISA